MTKSTMFASVGVMIIAGVCAGQAQTNSVTTNVTLVANNALSGFKQATGSKAAMIRITSKDLLAAVNNSGQFNFAKNAQLIFLSNEDQEPTIWVRQGSGANESLTDISEFFSITQPGEVDANHDLTSYAFRIFTFDDHNGLSFSVSGLTTMRRTHIVSRNIGPLINGTGAKAEVH
jgi:hypothetical protein